MRSFQTEKTRKRIIRAALRLFVRKGYHGTSISDISKSAKLTKGAIYFHFKNKDALLKKILEEYEENFLKKVFEEVGSVEGSGIDKFHHYLRFASNFAAQNREICLCLTSLSTELCGTPNKYEKWVKGIFRQYYEFMTQILEEGKKDGSFREDISPGVLAWNLIGTNEGNLLQWNMNRNEIDNRDFSRSLIKFFLTGICKPIGSPTRQTQSGGVQKA